MNHMPRPRQNKAEATALMNIIGLRARTVRKARGLFQADVADRADVSTEFYARIERGLTLPSVRTLDRLCGILGVSADSLMGQAEMPAFEPRAEDRPLTRQEINIRSISRRLRRARPETLRMVVLTLDALDRAVGLNQPLRLGCGLAAPDRP